MFTSHHFTSSPVYRGRSSDRATQYESGDLVLFQMRDQDGQCVSHVCNDQIGTVLRHDANPVCDTYSVRFASGFRMIALPFELELAPRLARGHRRDAVDGNGAERDAV